MTRQAGNSYHVEKVAVRRLLFVSYWVPPRMAIATVRSTHILTHLSRYGWDVTTVTARLENGGESFVQTGYWDVKGSIKRAFGLRWAGGARR